MNLRLLISSLVVIAGCAHTPAPVSSPAPASAAGVAAVKKLSPTPLVPMEDFFRNPAILGLRISPSGQYLAYLKSWKNRMNVFIAPVSSPSDERQITFLEDRDINEVHWKGSDYIIFEKDSGGDENYHLFAVDVRTGDSKDLTPFPGVRAQLMDDLEESSVSDILVTINQKNKELFDVYRINVESGDYRMMVENTYKISSWLVDHRGRVRGGMASDGVNSVFYFEKKAGKPFVPLFETNFRNSFIPVGFSSDNAHIFAVTNLNRNLAALVEVDPNLPSSKFIVRTLFEHPKYDVNDATYSQVRQTLGNVSVITDRRETYFLNPHDQKDWDYLKEEIDDGGLILANTSRDERYWVVKSLSDRSLGEYFVFDRTHRSITSLGKVSPWINAQNMAEMKTIHYKTRDGLEIEGYLTLPRARAGGEPLPVVVHPHGGPWARDEWGFNPEVQFLANQGYAVLQMNFRGSTSYGRAFWEASFKQWGQKMQDDISDGVKWLISEKIADPKRICIYGASYGGYATLAGLTFTPELYTCGVDYVGVANLFTFLKTIPPYWKPFLDMMYTMIGNPVKDKAMMMAVSPAFHVDRIRAPLFIAQGANDPRVNKNESDQMVEALRKRGVKVDYMVKAGEGHGFHNQENRFDFYRVMGKFLNQHLHGAAK